MQVRENMENILLPWKQNQEVQNKEQFLASILRFSEDAIVATDNHGFIHSWNPGAERIFGYRSKEILGRRLFHLLTPEFRRGKKAQVMEEEFKQNGFLKNIPIETLHKDGKRISTEMTRTVILDDHGATLGSSVILRDMSEKVKADQRMLQQEKTNIMGELAASLAHEIKNPLNSMVINMEVMKGHLSDLPEVKKLAITHYLNVLASETQRLDKVMQNFLNFAKPIDLQFRKLSIKRVLTDVIELIRAEANQKKIKIIETNIKTEASLEGSEGNIKQIFLNLLLNAIQAMPKGGKLLIHANDETPGIVEISIEDSGIGIPKNQYGKVFDLYFSTKEKGSGLGLPLVKRLVTAHGGTIDFISKVNYGTTFIIRFPSA